jgi:hypothetical protein
MTAALVASWMLSALAASPVRGQSPSGGTLPGDGDWSVSFTAFETDVVTQFGIFRMFGDRANVGLEAELDWADGNQTVIQEGGLRVEAEGTTWSFLVGPSVRWYGLRSGPVSPYLRTKLAVGWGGSELFVNENRQNEDDFFRFQASVAVGAEWYPIRWLGVGGHTGLVWQRTDTEAVNDNSGNTLEGATKNLRTFRSGLMVNFYFR